MQRRTADAKVKICIFIDSEHNEISVVEERILPFWMWWFGERIVKNSKSLWEMQSFIPCVMQDDGTFGVQNEYWKSLDKHPPAFIRSS